jgi:diadenosine tetraphosphate (Ap4A) HIT family hydrolase
MRAAGIDCLTEQGFRVAVEVRRQNASPEIHLIAGDRASAQNPQDWLTPSTTWNPSGPAAFFEKCAEAAVAGQERMAFGNQMVYAGGNREIFGVMDGDPKSEIHFLVLATRSFGNFMDADFTVDHMIKFFETAYRICEEMGVLDQHIRLVSNIGTGFQVGARVHMHVQSAREGLPSMFPHDYGFEVGEGGVIRAPEGSEVHGLVTTLIGMRQQIKGFSSHAAEVKQGIDQILLGQLEKIKIG